MITTTSPPFLVTRNAVFVFVLLSTLWLVHSWSSFLDTSSPSYHHDLHRWRHGGRWNNQREVCEHAPFECQECIHGAGTQDAFLCHGCKSQAEIQPALTEREVQMVAEKQVQRWIRHSSTLIWLGCVDTAWCFRPLEAVLLWSLMHDRIKLYLPSTLLWIVQWILYSTVTTMGFWYMRQAVYAFRGWFYERAKQKTVRQETRAALEGLSVNDEGQEPPYGYHIKNG